MNRTDLPFWIAGFEGADHLNRDAEPLDMTASTGHADLFDDDFRRLSAMGVTAVRESIGWRLAEPSPGHYDFERACRIAESARRHGLQVLWTFMHYGTPADLSLFDDTIIERFARFAGAAARALAPWQTGAPIYNPINEIGFISWAVSETNRFHPYLGDPEGRGDRSERSGYEVKRRLVKAALRRHGGGARRRTRRALPACRADRPRGGAA